MADLKQLPYLIKLLDDESKDIKDNIVRELIAFGPNLRHELKKIAFPLNDLQRQSIHQIFDGHKRMKLKQLWEEWFDLPTEMKKLEVALSLLSEFLSDFDADVQLKNLLDGLAADYIHKFKIKDPKLLSQFLFQEKGLLGEENDYYNPQNCNLIYVIQKKKGIPISLAAIYMLVGARLGLNIEGCNFPGHFLATIHLKDKLAYVDCFNGGHVIAKKDIMRVKQDVLFNVEKVLNETADAETIIRRFLANLIRAYQVTDNLEDGQLMIELFKDLDLRLANRKIRDLTPEDIIADAQPYFEAGQLVGHKRYGYRGIVVECDLVCKATDDWYYSNQTQPSRNQPWYHILVDGSDQVTYVAESNLVDDEISDSLEHPLLTYFFSKTKDGRYIRNENPWPETDF